MCKTKTILIQCPCGTIINQCDAKCDRCKEKTLVADRKRNANNRRTKSIATNLNEDLSKLASLYEGA